MSERIDLKDTIERPKICEGPKGMGVCSQTGIYRPDLGYYICDTCYESYKIEEDE